MRIDQLKQSIVRDLQKALLLKNKATLVVSGGSTPIELFKKLSKIKLPWEKITITLCDERYVSPKSSNSNQYLVKNYLLKNYAKKGNFIPLIVNKKANRKEIKNIGRFDVVILGMGLDGHTASLFPNNPKLKEAFYTKQTTINITPSTAPFQRVSLTKKALQNTKNLYLHTKGKTKKDILQIALKDGNIYHYPIVAFVDNKLKVYQL